MKKLAALPFALLVACGFTACSPGSAMMSDQGTQTRLRQQERMLKAVEEKAWVGYDKRQLENALSGFGFANVEYGRPYEDFFGRGYDEAAVIRLLLLGDLHIMLKDGVVAACMVLTDE